MWNVHIGGASQVRAWRFPENNGKPLVFVGFVLFFKAKDPVCISKAICVKLFSLTIPASAVCRWYLLDKIPVSTSTHLHTAIHNCSGHPAGTRSNTGFLRSLDVFVQKCVGRNATLFPFCACKSLKSTSFLCQFIFCLFGLTLGMASTQVLKHKAQGKLLISAVFEHLGKQTGDSSSNFICLNWGKWLFLRITTNRIRFYQFPTL